MRCLIRTVTRTGQAGLVHQDKDFVGERLTIGRAADQQIFLSDLRVALNHARITVSDGRPLLLSRVPSGVFYNDELVKFAYLEPGGRISLGSYEIRVSEPPAGYDLALAVERSQTSRGQELKQALLARSGIGLAATGIHPRRWSWFLALTILILFLIVPLVGFYQPPLQARLWTLPVVSDRSWNVGPLAAPHHNFSQDCKRCHTLPFIRVRDEACLECHQHQPPHIDPAKGVIAASTGFPCTTCHKDHNGPHGLINASATLCTYCHSQLNAVLTTTSLANVTGFSRDHPQFQVTLGGHDPAHPAQRVSLDQSEALQEPSNLRFPHEVHLAKKGIRGPDGQQVLGCSDCHVAEPGGAGMLPVRFEAHCQSCHQLTFESDDPSAVVPHGKPAVVLQNLEAYYALRALQGGYGGDTSAPDAVQRRRPGQALDTAGQRDALAWAKQRAFVVASELFQYRACATCHEVVSKVGPAGWEVKPVRVAGQWFPKARFSHERHQLMACGDCHEAERAHDSAAVLLPGIANCRQCHDDSGAPQRLQSSCITCHGFHTYSPARSGHVATAGK